MTATLDRSVDALARLENEGVRCTIAQEGLKFDIPKKRQSELSVLVEKLAKEHRRELVAALNWRSLTQTIGNLEKLSALHKLFELRLLEITVAEPTKEMKATLERHQEAGNTPVRLLLDGSSCGLPRTPYRTRSRSAAATPAASTTSR